MAPMAYFALKSKANTGLSRHMHGYHHVITKEWNKNEGVENTTYCVSPWRMRSQICRMDSQSVSSNNWLVALSDSECKLYYTSNFHTILIPNRTQDNKPLWLEILCPTNVYDVASHMTLSFSVIIGCFSTTISLNRNISRKIWLSENYIHHYISGSRTLFISWLDVSNHYQGLWPLKLHLPT